MEFGFNLSFKRGSKAKSGVENSRSYATPPSKVYVEKEGDYSEYSFESPAALAMLNDILYGSYGNRNFLELFYCLPEVYSAVHHIASRVSDCIWELKRTYNDQVDYNDEDFNRLFSKPNPMMTMKQLVYQAVCYEILTGRQFFYLNRPDTLPEAHQSILSWFNLPAGEVTVDMTKNDPYSSTEISDLVTGYSTPVNGRKREFDPRNVIPLINYDLKKGYDMNWANSLLKGAEKAIKNLIPVYAARGVIYIKRGAMGFIVSRKTDDSGTVALTKSEKKELEEDYQKSYGLSEGKQTVGITGMPVDFIRTGMSIEELQPFDETLANAIAIYSTLRIPRHLCPDKNNSTFANANSDEKSFWESVIIPWAKKYAEAWTEGMWMRNQRKYIDVNFKHIGVLQEDKKAKSDIERIMGTVWLERWKNGVCTLNDWCIAVDLPKGSGSIYEKRIFELTPEEVSQVSQALNLKTTNNGNDQKPSPQDTGAPAAGQANNV